ncbi:MAG TPA: hypothetical protein VGM37_07175 [Armatimonadota bacterium]|jgi:heme/copper-type cytochrome/quinol oxidase subunit 2
MRYVLWSAIVLAIIGCIDSLCIHVWAAAGAHCLPMRTYMHSTVSFVLLLLAMGLLVSITGRSGRRSASATVADIDRRLRARPWWMWLPAYGMTVYAIAYAVVGARTVDFGASVPAIALARVHSIGWAASYLLAALALNAWLGDSRRPACDLTARSVD